MNAYRDKLVEAMARAIAIAAGWPIEMWDNPNVYSTSEAAKEAYYAFARAALDAALGVLAETRMIISDSGGVIHEIRGAPDDIWRSMIRKIQEHLNA